MYDVTMPKLSDSMEVGKIIRWRVAEGDAVHEGDILADVESDKAEMELESFHDGVVLKIAHAEGDEVPIGEVIALLGESGESVETAGTKVESPAPPPPPPEPKKVEKSALLTPSVPVAAPKPPPPRPDGARVAISPYARRLAAERGVDYAKISGSGPGGRIVAADVLAVAGGGGASVKRTPKKADRTAVDPMAGAVAARLGVDVSGVAGTGTGGRVTVDDVMAAHGKIAPEIAPSPDEELPPLELAPGEAEVSEAPFRLKTQARRVSASKHVIPHFYMTRGANVTRLLARKDEVKAKWGATLTHLVMLAALKALGKHPGVNRSYDHGKIIAWKDVNLGLAVATEGGLTVAVLPGAGSLSLPEIVERTGPLVERARAGKLSAADRKHATFTVTNLGMYDIEHFEPIINPPSAITLAVSSALEQAVVEDGKVSVGRVMGLTLSCDHRIVDGVAAAEFLRDLRALLEDPDALLA